MKSLRPGSLRTSRLWMQADGHSIIIIIIIPSSSMTCQMMRTRTARTRRRKSSIRSCVDCLDSGVQGCGLSGFHADQSSSALGFPGFFSSRGVTQLIRVGSAPTALILLPSGCSTRPSSLWSRSFASYLITQTALARRCAYLWCSVDLLLCGTPSSIPHADPCRPVTHAPRPRGSMLV